MGYRNGAKRSLTSQLLLQGGVEVRTLSGDITLGDTDANLQIIDPGGAARTVTTPASADANGLFFVIRNVADADEAITVSADGSTLTVVQRGEAVLIASTGAAWRVFLRETTLAGDTGVIQSTLSGNATLSLGSPNYQRLDPNGANRDVTLPAVTAGAWFHITNIADAAENLVVKNAGGSTIGTLNQNEAAVFVSNGTVWTHMGIQTIAQS